jgi:hypothetical protein
MNDLFSIKNAGTTADTKVAAVATFTGSLNTSEVKVSYNDGTSNIVDSIYRIVKTPIGIS